MIYYSEQLNIYAYLPHPSLSPCMRLCRNGEKKARGRPEAGPRQARGGPEAGMNEEASAGEEGVQN